MVDAYPLLTMKLFFSPLDVIAVSGSYLLLIRLIVTCLLLLYDKVCQGWDPGPGPSRKHRRAHFCQQRRHIPLRHRSRHKRRGYRRQWARQKINHTTSPQLSLQQWQRARHRISKAEECLRAAHQCLTPRDGRRCHNSHHRMPPCYDRTCVFFGTTP